MGNVDAFQAVTPDPYGSRVTAELVGQCSLHLLTERDDLAAAGHDDATLKEAAVSLGLMAHADSREFLQWSLENLSAVDRPPWVAACLHLARALGSIDLAGPDGEPFPARPATPFGDMDPQSFSNRLSRALAQVSATRAGISDQPVGSAPPNWFKARVLEDAAGVGAGLRRVIEAILDAGGTPEYAVGGLTLADLAGHLAHPIVAAVVLDGLDRDPHAYEPVIVQAGGRLTIAEHYREPAPAWDAAAPTDLASDLAYHTARYLRRVADRGDGSPALDDLRRPLEPVALRLVPDRAAADDLRDRLANAREVLAAAADDTTRDPARRRVDARAGAAADAVLALTEPG